MCHEGWRKDKDYQNQTKGKYFETDKGELLGNSAEEDADLFIVIDTHIL